MKKIFLIISLVSVISFAHAKKVKFAVNMTDQTISTYGVHVAGDFQTIAGFTGGDWASNTTLMTQEADTNIYSIVVDIPAFSKYEYKFLNGDQWYNVEFVPIESRVGYNGNDNRWIYVDSLADDTTCVGAILFSGNAPTGLTLVRFMVDMQTQTSINNKGVHIAGSFQGWDPIKTILYHLDTTTQNYEIISYVDTGNYEYKYYNGNTMTTSETVPGECSTNGNRYLYVTHDTVFSTICFSSCSVCNGVGIAKNKVINNVKLFPNPSSDYSILELNDPDNIYNIKIINQTGQLIREYSNISNSLIINKNNLPKGIYTVSITQNKYLKSLFIKLIIL